MSKILDIIKLGKSTINIAIKIKTIKQRSLIILRNDGQFGFYRQMAYTLGAIIR